MAFFAVQIFLLKVLQMRLVTPLDNCKFEAISSILIPCALESNAVMVPIFTLQPRPVLCPTLTKPGT